MSLLRRIRDRYQSVARLAGLAQTPLLAAIRLYWGWQFAVTGWGKLHSLDRVTEFFGSLHLPMPGFTAAFVASVEFFGGVLLALGVGTRLVALVLFINMSVAFWVADRDALYAVFSAPEKFYGADPFLFWAAALLLLIFGPGAWSADRWLGVERHAD